MKIEFEKLLRQRKMTALVIIVLMSVYVYLAFAASIDTFSGLDRKYFLTHEDYREWLMSKQTEKVDEAWTSRTEKEYRNLIDENMLSADEIAERLKWEKENGFFVNYTVDDVLANPYNIEYAFDLLPSEVFYSRDMESFYPSVFKVYIPLAEDAVGYLHESYDESNRSSEENNGISYAEYMGYSEAQLNDYWNFVDSRYRDFELTVGYCLGWDILCTVMQFLPYTLGLALIMVLGSLFSQEKSCGMVPILRTAKNGRARLLRQKLMIALCTATALWLLFQLVMLLAVALSYTLQGATCTAIAFDGKPSIYGFTWLEYYLVQCAFSYCGTLVFALFVCCTSSLMSLKLLIPLNLVITLFCGIPINRFCFADKAFSLLDKLRAITPPQLMAAYPNLQVYQSYELGSFIVQLAYVMAAATLVETVLMLLFLKKQEG